MNYRSRQTTYILPAGKPNALTLGDKADPLATKVAFAKSLRLTADEAQQPSAHTRRPFQVTLPLPISPSSPQSRRTPTYTQPPFRTVDELLRTCPTHAEIMAIRADFNISFAHTPPRWGCTLGGSESSAMLTVYNALRVMRLVRFDEQIPVLHATNLYEWLFSLDLRGIQLTVGEEYSFALPRELFIRSELLADPSFRQWIDPASATGLDGLVILLVHEGRHATGGGIPHNCNNEHGIIAFDTNLAYGGAWAAQYWADRYMAEHAPRYFTPAQRQIAMWNAQNILENICRP